MPDGDGVSWRDYVDTMMDAHRSEHKLAWQEHQRQHTYKCAPGYYVLHEILRYPRRSRHGTLKAQTCC